MKTTKQGKFKVENMDKVKKTEEKNKRNKARKKGNVFFVFLGLFFLFIFRFAGSKTFL